MEGQNVVYNTSPGPYVGAPLSVRAPLGHIKGRARPLQHKLGFTPNNPVLNHLRTQAHEITHTGSPKHSQTLSRQGNTTHSGRRVLRFGGPNHSKSLVFIVFLSKIELGLANPRVHTLWARAGAFRHPAVVCSTTTTGLEW